MQLYAQSDQESRLEAQGIEAGLAAGNKVLATARDIQVAD